MGELTVKRPQALGTIKFYSRRTISFIRTPYNLDYINGLGGLSVNHCHQSYEQHFTIKPHISRSRLLSVMNRVMSFSYIVSNYVRNINSKNDIVFSTRDVFMRPIKRKGLNCAFGHLNFVKFVEK